MYNFWQYLHVLFATTWVGAAVLDVFLSLRLSALRDNPVAGPASGLMEKSSVPLFIGSSLGTLITGLILAFGWVTFDPLWIKIGLGGAILSIVVGIAYFAPHGEKVEAAVEASGPNDPAVNSDGPSDTDRVGGRAVSLRGDRVGDGCETCLVDPGAKHRHRSVSPRSRRSFKKPGTKGKGPQAAELGGQYDA
jgi:hypothetical protein